MLRGVINIDQAEAIEAYKSFAAFKSRSSSLYNKLDAAQRSIAESVEVFLSAEDAELLMDSLPVPRDAEPQQVTSLRGKLLKFLADLRQQGEI